MQRLASGRLRNLLPAAESVGDDDRIRRRLAYLRQEDALADAHGDLVVAAFEAECAGHPATSGIRMLDVQADLAQQLHLWLEFHDRGVVAVGLHDRFTFHSRELELVTFNSNEFAEGHHRVAQPPCGFVLRKEIVQLVAKDRHTARLEAHDGYAFVQRWPECLHRAAQKRFRHSQKAPVIEWPSAAEPLS